ncbi:MAG TPA: hypothetical protein VF603_15125 [Allosphingosinicella sp.]|jgi:hypothetical protein
MIRTIALAACALLVSCTGQDGLTPRQRATSWALENARPAGEAEDCVVRRNIRETVILDDRTIDFHMTGGRVLRNRLPHACPGLAFDDGFSYRTSLDRLCSVDTITVRRSSGPPGPTCGLGPFQPVEIAPR